LEQGRFAIDAMDPFLVWHVPVVAQAMDGTSWQGIVSAAAPADLKPLSPGGTVVNVGQVGYFRTQYAPELVTALAERFGSLHAVDQLGTLLDAEALGMAGYEPFPDVLELARRVDSASHPQVQRTVAAILTDLARLYRNRPAEATYQGYARSVVERMLAGTGWSPAAGERPEVGALRAALIQALGNLDDAHATDWARDWFASYSRDPQSVPAELRNVMLQVVAMHADAGQWSQLHTLAKGAHSGAQQDDLYNMLGLARDPQLAQQALDLTLTDEVELTVKPDIVSFVAIGHPEMAFDFAVAHRELVNTWVEPDVRDVFEARLLDHSVDPAALERLNTYIESLAHASDRKGAEVASARMRDNIKVRAERLPQIDAWLQSRRP
jgi:aminopeptidase N